VFHPVDYSILNHRVSSSRLGHAFSTHSVSGNLGWAAAPAFMLWLSSVANWHVAGLGAALVALSMLALIHLRRQWLEYDLPQEDAQEGSHNRGGHFAFMGISAVWLCFGFFFFTTLSFGALENFAAPLLSHLYGVSLTAATACFTGYLLGSSVGVVSGGFLATHLHSHQKIIGGALVAAVLMAIYLSTGAVPVWLMSILFTLMGFSVGLSNPSRDMLVRKTTTTVLGRGALGRVYGFVYSGLDTGLATAPLIFGPIMDGAHYSLVLLGMGLSLAMAIVTAVSIKSA
jgi:predicted MFS family arabinose efflux permease